MIKNSSRTLLITFLVISFLSCTNEGRELPSEEIETVELPDEGIDIQDAWARPGRMDGVSAIYMIVLNGSVEADSLISIFSPVAGRVEIHETYEREEGMMGMRRAENVVFPARNRVSLKPGGMHVMLMQLNRELTEGDEVELTIEFANAGEMSIVAPVQTLD